MKSNFSATEDGTIDPEGGDMMADQDSFDDAYWIEKIDNKISQQSEIKK